MKPLASDYGRKPDLSATRPRPFANTRFAMRPAPHPGGAAWSRALAVPRSSAATSESTSPGSNMPPYEFLKNGTVEFARLPGRLDARTPEDVDAGSYDLAVLAMQEPQYANHSIATLLAVLA